MNEVMQSSSVFHLSRALKIMLPLMGAVIVAACGPADDVSDFVPVTLTRTPIVESSAQAVDPTPEATAPTAAAEVTSLIDSPAPSIVDPTGWLNTDPITIEQFRGSVILIDFWTYTCVNCIRTLPYLKEWHEKYEEQGLVILGVHSPEFEFEAVLANVADAVERHGLEYGIVQDNQMGTWRAFGNTAWPAKYLIDAEGIVRYTHFGEGAYNETELAIRGLLGEAGASLGEIAVNPDADPVPDSQAFATVETGQTRELYAGFVRNFNAEFSYIANVPYYNVPAADLAFPYTDPGDHNNHFLYLHGTWKNGAESITHGRVTEDFEDYVALKFHGTSANIVVDLEEGEQTFPVVVTLDGGPIPQALWGSDIELDAEGRTVFRADSARMYRIVEAPEYGGHELTFSANSDRFGVFAFTFGSYASGP